MFRGRYEHSIDAKGRLAIPARHREQLAALSPNALVLTLNPWDRCLWLYPISEWEVIEQKLQQLSDFDRHSRRTKQIMRGYANDCSMDLQGRVLIPQELRDFANVSKKVVFFGQGNKFEIWDQDTWAAQRDDWLQRVDTGDGSSSDALASLAL